MSMEKVDLICSLYQLQPMWSGQPCCNQWTKAILEISCSNVYWSCVLELVIYSRLISVSYRRGNGGSLLSQCTAFKFLSWCSAGLAGVLPSEEMVNGCASLACLKVALMEFASIMQKLVFMSDECGVSQQEWIWCLLNALEWCLCL